MSKILIVDDEEFGIETIRSMLEGQGYDLETAASGEKALVAAERLRPDLILLDVMMPGMDGIEVCRQLRAQTELGEVPILIVTALEDRQSRLMGIAAGADDFLSKPLDGEELRARVRTILRLNRYRTLVEQRENLKAMARRVVQAQEAERLRISREIHDDIGQALFAHQLALKTIRDRIPDESGVLRQALEQMIVESNSIFSKLRLLAQDLRPPLLDTVGVGMALKVYCNDFSRRTSLPIIYEEDGESSSISDILNVTLYRVLQESLSNIARHARASKAWVTFSVDDQEISLTVQDNGQGIAGASQMNQGVGIQGMRERVILAGGIFSLKSNPNQGTVISVRFPFNTKGYRGD